MKYYYGNCVNFPDPVEDLTAMVESGVQITRRTFLKHVHREDLKSVESSLGYPMGRLTMAGDWAVSYWKGRLYGIRGVEVVWFSHSSIEYVFK
jgi:hypothetical protein